MNHEFIVQYPNSKEKISSTMVIYGTQGGYTATAKTVGLPIGIAANLLTARLCKASKIERNPCSKFKGNLCTNLEGIAKRRN